MNFQIKNIEKKREDSDEIKAIRKRAEELKGAWIVRG